MSGQIPMRAYVSVACIYKRGADGRSLIRSMLEYQVATRLQVAAGLADDLAEGCKPTRTADECLLRLVLQRSIKQG